jgi:hypothetical protein
MQSSDRIDVYVPSCFVVPAPPPPSPPPMPGTVSLADIKPPPPDPTFIMPWKQHFATERVDEKTGVGKHPLPCMVDTKLLATYHQKFDVATTLVHVFKHLEPKQRDATVAAVLASLENPFASNNSPIVWHLDKRIYLAPNKDAKLGGKKLAVRHKTLLHGTPWTIRCFAEPGRGPFKNMVYGEDGIAIAQIDLIHPALSMGLHCHALVKDNLDHTPSEDPNHLFWLRNVPWCWCVIPQMTERLCLELLAKKTGDNVDSDDDEADVQEMLALASPLPDLRELNKIAGWVPCSLPYEDFLGSGSTSQ